MKSPYLDRLMGGVPVAPDMPGIRYGAGVEIHADTPRGPVFGHAGWIPAYVSSLRHDADHGVTMAFLTEAKRFVETVRRFCADVAGADGR